MYVFTSLPAAERAGFTLAERAWDRARRGHDLLHLVSRTRRTPRGLAVEQALARPTEGGGRS